ncbi:MAG: insulinase family protein, partial [Candidatus Latescibacteria bacterium]|nr:insulinase family protein [Candidatus Latescibacterota bacterium]
NQEYLEIGFHAPGVLAPDTDALDLAAAIIGRGRSARLYQRVKEDLQVVDTIGADSYAYADVGLFHASATLDPANRERALAAIVEEVERLKTDPVSDEELERALAMVESSYVFQQQSVNGQAFVLAYYEAYGGYTLVDDHLRRLYGVTKDDLRRVAERYLRFSNCSIVEYVPAGAPTLDRTVVSVEQALSERLQTLKPADTRPASPLRRAAPWGDVGGPGRPDADGRTFVLPNGLVLIVKELHAVPVVSIGAFCRGGRNEETRTNAGLTTLALRTSRKGTVSRSADVIAREIERLGTTVEFVVDADYFGYTMTILQRHANQGFDVFQDIIRNPTFPAPEVDKERDNLLAAILRDKDSAFTRPFQLFNEAFYGDHPYALPSTGLDESVRGLTGEALRDWHARALDPGRMVVAVAGDVDAERVHDLIGQSLGSLPGRPDATDGVRAVVPPSSIRTAVETRTRKQTAMALGFAGTDVRHPDRYGLEVLANVASSFGGRLFMELRGRQSLAYTVVAYDMPRRVGGTFVAYIATDVAKEDRAREGLLREFVRFTEEPPADEEVQRAHAYMAGSYTIRLQTAAAQAAEYARNALLGLGLDEFQMYPDRIRQVTRDDLHRAANTYFDTERYAIGMVRGTS